MIAGFFSKEVMGGDGMRSGEEMRVERYYMWDDARRVEWGA